VLRGGGSSKSWHGVRNGDGGSQRDDFDDGGEWDPNRNKTK